MMSTDVKKYNREYYEKNKERIREYAKEYRKKYPDRVNETNKKYYRTHPKFKKHISEYGKQYKIKNKEMVRNRNRRYLDSMAGRLLLHERLRKYKNKRRALIKISKKDYTLKDLQKIYSDCVYCGSGEDLQTEHIIPLTRGGTDTINNTVLACKICNCSKNNRNVYVWCQERNIKIPEIVNTLLILQELPRG